MSKSIMCRYCQQLFTQTKIAQQCCKGCYYLEFLDKSLVPRHKFYYGYGNRIVSMFS